MFLPKNTNYTNYINFVKKSMKHFSPIYVLCNKLYVLVSSILVETAFSLYLESILSY